jgi:curved DNA-binding protein CbpA
MADKRFADYYEVLQVSPRADSETIEGIYRHLARRYHPDNRESGNSDRFSELVEAYEILSDPGRRAQYDVGYEQVLQERWRIFDQQTTTSEIASDTRIRQAIMSILYMARRNNPDEPGVGVVALERLLGCAQQTIKFHLWYLRENGWVERLTSGHMGITAQGIDRLFDIGGPAKAGPALLSSGSDAGTTNGQDG